MEITAVVLYQGALAYYTVSRQGDGTYVARLLSYCGAQGSEPPPTIHFWSDGRHCDGSIEDGELMDDLWLAVKEKIREIQVGGSDLSAVNPNQPYVFI